MKEHIFTITYKLSCEDISLNKKETFTVEHDDPHAAEQLAYDHCCVLWRAATEAGCTLSNLVGKNEKGEVVFKWK